jgi:small subunit ribosomal protein S9
MADEPEQPESAESSEAPEAAAEPPAPAEPVKEESEAAAPTPEPPAADAAPAAEVTQPAKAPKRRRKAKTDTSTGKEAAATDSAGTTGSEAKAEEPVAEASASDAPAAEPAGADTAQPAASEAPSAEADAAPAADASGAPAETRAKPEVPGAHLEVDIVPEGADPLGREQAEEDPYAIGFEEEAQAEEHEEEPPSQEEEAAQPIVSAAIDLAAGARYRATGKRKTAVARVILRPGGGDYTINGRSLAEYFPRSTLQRNICQPLEAVGYQEKMDVVARLHGGGVSSQAGALRHGISRALLEADPNLRGELKRRGFLTRDSRVKERKKAGLKKARKRPQFSKR